MKIAHRSAEFKPVVLEVTLETKDEVDQLHRVLSGYINQLGGHPKCRAMASKMRHALEQIK